MSHHEWRVEGEDKDGLWAVDVTYEDKAEAQEVAARLDGHLVWRTVSEWNNA